MNRIDALNEISVAIKKMNEVLEAQSGESAIMVVDPSCQEESISVAIDALDSLGAWINRETTKQEEEDNHELFLQEGGPGYEVGE